MCYPVHTDHGSLFLSKQWCDVSYLFRRPTDLEREIPSGNIAILYLQTIVM